jgi:hypothetical protein
MKPGRITCAGLVGIMMVLPSSIWKKDSARQVIPRVVVYESSVEAAGAVPAFPVHEQSLPELFPAPENH